MKQYHIESREKDCGKLDNLLVRKPARRAQTQTGFISGKKISRRNN